MERVDAPASVESEPVVPSLASVELVPLAGAPLVELVSQARAPGSAGNAALLELIKTLETLEPNEANATALVELLDGHAFDTLRREDGTPARELAIRALLTLGWPYALRVAPEDLQWLRTEKTAAFRVNVLFFLLLTGAGVGVWHLIGSLL